jgi:hypothetical protein
MKTNTKLIARFPLEIMDFKYYLPSCDNEWDRLIKFFPTKMMKRFLSDIYNRYKINTLLLTPTKGESQKLPLDFTPAEQELVKSKLKELNEDFLPQACPLRLQKDNITA